MANSFKIFILEEILSKGNEIIYKSILKAVAKILGAKEMLRTCYLAMISSSLIQQKRINSSSKKVKIQELF
ncbi:hypothetical protein Glove_33g37 [Diversispora epigaea]|uniref:Uncharacterized protein n=1 Tax=Diversispora epigaea TaxID=1348612 RepID=A0A397JR30_9GLOM|nr:hypothetical protein Glove_33g37 [Diversispora epigaea]